MQGQILSYDAGEGEGLIAGAGSLTYRFVAGDIVSGQPLKPGQQVDFTATADGQAQKIVVLAQAPATFTGGRVDLGRVIQHTFIAIGRNTGVFFGAATLFVGLPSLFTRWGKATIFDGAGATAALATGGGLLLYFLGFYLLQGLVLKAALNSIEGRKTAFASAFDVGRRAALPLLALAIISTLAIALGFLLLIFPGLILFVWWVVAAPVLALERRGIFESLGRSRQLVRGHAWAILGLAVIYLVFSWLVSFTILMIVNLVFSIGLNTSTVPNTIAANAVSNVIKVVVASAGAAALYHELRALKEGFGADDLAAIFD